MGLGVGQVDSLFSSMSAQHRVVGNRFVGRRFFGRVHSSQRSKNREAGCQGMCAIFGFSLMIVDTRGVAYLRKLGVKAETIGCA